MQSIENLVDSLFASHIYMTSHFLTNVVKVQMNRLPPNSHNITRHIDHRLMFCD